MKHVKTGNCIASPPWIATSCAWRFMKCCIAKTSRRGQHQRSGGHRQKKFSTQDSGKFVNGILDKIKGE